MHAQQAMHSALGLADGRPPKPLVWRHCGHPGLAASLQLTNAVNQLLRSLAAPRHASLLAAIHETA